MGTGRRAAPVLAACAMQGLWAAPALGHASERGQIMLLPTGLYMLGGGLAVLASVLLMIFLPAVARWKAPQRELSIANIPPVLRILTSLVSLALLSVLVFAGFFGPADPISNPLPGFNLEPVVVRLHVSLLVGGQPLAAVQSLDRSF